MNKVIEMVEAQTGKMDMILRESHVDTRVRKCILMNVNVPKLGYAGEP